MTMQIGEVAKREALDGSAPARHFDISTPALRWASDSSSFVYIRNENSVSSLWSQPLTGAEPKHITHFTGELIYDFSLSRDGKHLLLDRGNEDSDVVLIHDSR